MLRIRGSLYLGRQYESQKGGGSGGHHSDHDSEQHDDDSYGADEEDDHEDDMLGMQQGEEECDNLEEGFSNPSLLEKILSSRRRHGSPAPITQQQQQQQQQQIITNNQSLCSGGSVTDLGREVVNTKLALLVAEASNSLPLTPPPSISGECGSSRATPPDSGISSRDGPLDLTTVKLTTPTPKSSPVMADHQQQPTWKVIVSGPESQDMYYDLSQPKMKQHQLEDLDDDDERNGLEDDVLIAAHALLSLSNH